MVVTCLAVQRGHRLRQLTMMMMTMTCYQQANAVDVPLYAPRYSTVIYRNVMFCFIGIIFYQTKAAAIPK